jgi:O-glycosyl hydrolase
MRNLFWGLTLCLASTLLGQTSITQNNLVQNGGFDSGSTDWSNDGDGAYFYSDGSENILSLGWSNGEGFWQDTGASIQAGLDYVLTIRALVGQSPLTGVNLSFQDVTTGWTWLTNQTFYFPDQTATWRVFSLYISSNTIAANVGDTIGVGGQIVESPASQYGWLWVDWMQLAPAIPQFTISAASVTNFAGASAVLNVGVVGAITNDTGQGSALQYQWYASPSSLLPNATNATLFFPSLSLTNSGGYYLVAAGPYGSNRSSNVTLVVQPAPSAQASVAIDPNQQLVDSFDGWGTSLCWWANVCGGYSNRATLASLAFTTLGLNIVRYNIGGGENPNLANTMEYRAQMQGFEPTNGVWNWNADANQRWMLRRAVALGANHVVAFANSPPWWMTVSGSVTGSTNGTSNNLQTNYEAAFVQYLANVVSNLTILDGVTFEVATPMNEPTGSWWVYGGRQEGCHMDATQQNRVVNDLRSALTAAKLTTGIDASEDTDEADTVNSVSSYDAAGKTNVTLVASHTYGANDPSGLESLAATLNLPAWISEYSDSDGTGIPMARRIHDDITQTAVRAWTCWQVVDNVGGWGLLYNPEDDTGNTNFTYNEKFYVMWQFSHFIRPGFQIISVDDDYSLAAYDATNHNLVIVAINDSTNSLDFDYTLEAFNLAGTQVVRWRTSANENGAPLPSLTVSNQQVAAYLAPLSVTTMVISNLTVAGPQLAAWYPLEGNGLDATGNGNNATLVTNVTFVPGRIGAWAAQFSGTNSYLVIPRSISNSFTITCWVKTTATGGGSQWWAGKGIVDGEVQGTTYDFGLALVGSVAGFGIGNPDTTITSTNAINDGQWHHLAAAWDSSSGLMQLYVDGVFQASTTGPTGTRSAPPSLRLGSIQAGYAGGFLAGTIDDVQLFAQVLTPGQIVNTMNHAPTLAAVAPSTVLAGRTLLITNTATDPAVPAESLTWSLQSAPSGATISALTPTNGLLSWRPAIAQSPSTNVFNVVVTDNGSPQCGATQSVSVTVLRPARPQLAHPAWTNHGFTFEADGDAGPDYIVEAATNMHNPINWKPLITNLSASPPWEWTDLAVTNQASRFYRVLLGP